jgi:YrbI family 3-deoxy-D-manno-octulosonate 8-phosphate phosphatase
MVVFDFDGVFTTNQVLISQDGAESVLCWRGDGLGLAALKKIGIELLVVSTEKNPVVKQRCKKLDLRCIQGCDNKVEILKQEAAKLGIALENIAFMGNDINDKDCLTKVGLPVCVADAHKDVIKYAKLVIKSFGGYGAVRELCDFIVKVKNGKLS